VSWLGERAETPALRLAGAIEGTASLPSGLEQLERVAIRILDLDLAPAWTSFHLVPEVMPLDEEV
jgi:hypothetical protein